MANRFRPHNVPWYGKVFKMGDKAVIYAYLAAWRKANPLRKLSLLTYPDRNETGYARALNNQMLFGNIIDELLIMEHPKDPIIPLKGDNLYTAHLFALWRTLHAAAPLSTVFSLPAEAAAAHLCQLKAWHVPPGYAVLSPLYDAAYDKHRNVPPGWWAAAARVLSLKMPVVIVGDGGALRNFPPAQTNNVFPVYKHSPTPLQTMAMIKGAAVYIGGETGMTLWAGLMRVPTVAVYAYWDKGWWKNTRRGLDTRPIGTGQPIAWVHPAAGHDCVATAALSIARRG